MHEEHTPLISPVFKYCFSVMVYKVHANMKMGFILFVKHSFRIYLWYMHTNVYNEKIMLITFAFYQIFCFQQTIHTHSIKKNVHKKTAIQLYFTIQGPIKVQIRTILFHLTWNLQNVLYTSKLYTYMYIYKLIHFVCETSKQKTFIN